MKHPTPIPHCIDFYDSWTFDDIRRLSWALCSTFTVEREPGGTYVARITGRPGFGSCYARACCEVHAIDSALLAYWPTIHTNHRLCIQA